MTAAGRRRCGGHEREGPAEGDVRPPARRGVGRDGRPVEGGLRGRRDERPGITRTSHTPATPAATKATSRGPGPAALTEAGPTKLASPTNVGRRRSAGRARAARHGRGRPPGVRPEPAPAGGGRRGRRHAAGPGDALLAHRSRRHDRRAVELLERALELAARAGSPTRHIAGQQARDVARRARRAAHGAGEGLPPVRASSWRRAFSTSAISAP